MSSTRIMERWVRNVLRGEGKPRSDADERFSYRGPVLYSYERPAARLINAHGNNWYCIDRLGVHPRNPKEWKDGPRLIETLHNQPCIGVFTKFDGDQLDDAATHERIKMLDHMEAQLLIEQALTWPADKLLTNNLNWKGKGQLTREMDLLYMRYMKYRDAFRLKWSDFPQHYNADLTAAINDRARDYYDPKAIEQRDRQVARREAKKAFGIE